MRSRYTIAALTILIALAFMPATQAQDSQAVAPVAESPKYFTASGVELDASACDEKVDRSTLISDVLKQIQYELDLQHNQLILKLDREKNVFDLAISGKSMVITDQNGRKNETGTIDFSSGNPVYRYKATAGDCQTYVVRFAVTQAETTTEIE